MKNEQEFTVLRTFNNAGEAAVLKSLLDSAGIDNLIRNDITSTVLTMLNESVGVKVVIRTADLKKAEDFLQAEIAKNEE